MDIDQFEQLKEEEKVEYLACASNSEITCFSDGEGKFELHIRRILIGDEEGVKKFDSPVDAVKFGISARNRLREQMVANQGTYVVTRDDMIRFTGLIVSIVNAGLLGDHAARLVLPLVAKDLEKKIPLPWLIDLAKMSDLKDVDIIRTLRAMQSINLELI